VRYDGTHPEVGKWNALVHFDGRIADRVPEIVVDAKEIYGVRDLLEILTLEER
jgi:hypothetical protein